MSVFVCVCVCVCLCMCLYVCVCGLCVFALNPFLLRHRDVIIKRPEPVLRDVHDKCVAFHLPR